MRRPSRSSQARPRGPVQTRPRWTTRPRPPVPRPTESRTFAVTVKKNDDKVEAPQELDYGRMALGGAAGDEAGGSRYAALALAADTRMSMRTPRWHKSPTLTESERCGEHYAVVRTKPAADRRPRPLCISSL